MENKQVIKLVWRLSQYQQELMNSENPTPAQRSGEEIKLINDYGIVWEIDPDDPAKLRGEYKGQAIARHPSCYAVEGVPYDSLSEAVAAIDQSR